MVTTFDRKHGIVDAERHRRTLAIWAKSRQYETLVLIDTDDADGNPERLVCCRKCRLKVKSMRVYSGHLQVLSVRVRHHAFRNIDVLHLYEKEMSANSYRCADDL